MTARVAVVIPAFQAGRWLRDTLRSVQDQSVDDWSCVVVDDGSTDDTVLVAEDVAASDRRVTVLRHSNQGVGAARNAGLHTVTAAEFVCFVDADDLLLPNTFETLLGSLQTRPDAVGAYGLAELIDEAGLRTAPGRHANVQRNRRIYAGGRWLGRLNTTSPTSDLTYDELVVNNPFWPPAVGMLRMPAVLAAGGFDASYRYAEDWHLWLRMSKQGPFVAVDTVTAEYRQHAGNATGASGANIASHARLRAEASRSATPSDQRAAAGAWRAVLRSSIFHQLWLTSRHLRDGRPLRAAASATAAALYCACMGFPRPLGPNRLWHAIQAVRAKSTI